MNHNNFGRVLIVGVNSLIGSALYKDFKGSGISIIGTSRRVSAVFEDPRIIYLNLEDEVIDESRLPNVDTVYLMASVTSMDQCVTDPTSYTINVSSIAKVGDIYIRRGCFVIYASTNAVFSGNKFMPNEYDSTGPLTAYGEQKRDAEIALINSAALSPQGSLAIVRMTKILANDNALIKDWCKSIFDNHPIEAFTDLKISPISLNYVITNLKMIGEKRCKGIYHLSGSGDVSYFELASQLVRNFGGTVNQVLEKMASNSGIPTPYFSSLGMPNTKNVFGIKPESFEECLENAFEHLKKKTN